MASLKDLYNEILSKLEKEASEGVAPSEVKSDVTPDKGDGIENNNPVQEVTSDNEAQSERFENQTEPEKEVKITGTEDVTVEGAKQTEEIKDQAKQEGVGEGVVEKQYDEPNVENGVDKEAFELGESIAVSLAKVAFEESYEAFIEYKVASESVVIPVEDYVKQAQKLSEEEAEFLLKSAEEAIASLGDEKLASQVSAFIVHPEFGIIGVM